MKDNGEIAELRTKWWKGECSSSATAIASSLTVSVMALLFARFM
jgi:hypothetical protein